MSSAFRDNPPVPSDEQLREWFDLASGEGKDFWSVLGLRAVWRAGCDAGMQAEQAARYDEMTRRPLPIPSSHHQADQADS